jgi:hypothetical protein
MFVSHTSSISHIWRVLLLWAVLSVVPVAFLEGLRLAVGAPFSWDGLVARWVFVVVLLFAARWTCPCLTGGGLWAWPWSGILVAGVGGGATLVYAVTQTTWAAWAMMGALYVLLLGLDTALGGRQSLLRRWGVHGLLALAGGLIPVAISQIESHFADEEFFVALQALALAFFWTLLLAVKASLPWERVTLARQGLRFDRRWLAVLLVLLAFLGTGVTVRAYQRSFYTLQAPAYPGISYETPFLCGESSPDSQTFDGHKVFQRLLARVEANPHKGPPEYGMLALGTGEQGWAQAFRESLLGEVAKGRFTGPAHSVKYAQYEAALRAYYYPRVRAAFPSLFTPEEEQGVRDWFAAINRRALTVEWVDWMYALAFTKWPEGPYENQENGAGLLALLESEGLAGPNLSLDNQDYLERNRRGWLARFRNTDDALIYQPEWINNAFFQSLYTGEALTDHARLSFEWLLLQFLPDGTPLRYNHPAQASLAGIAYLGARLLEDPRYIWLAGRALEDVEARNGYLFAQPGVEEPVSLVGRSPNLGSCLLYGDSGLPNQIGPLAPDKIVFRDGWSEESVYLLLNLRFTGWHRYKATNTISLLYQDSPLVSEILDGEPFTWLPIGRSAFRDKRVPRGHLNGLLIERTGMSAVLYGLTGVGGPWAQDPPFYAEVVTFETGDTLDWSHTRLQEWRGWQHDRWIYFYHGGGPIVVVDRAEGPTTGQAALMWHLVGKEIMQGQRVRLRGSERLVEMLFVPVDADETHLEVTEEQGCASGLRVIYYPPSGSRLYLATMFLPGRWVGAEAGWERGAEGLALRIARDGERITLPMP